MYSKALVEIGLKGSMKMDNEVTRGEVKGIKIFWGVALILLLIATFFDQQISEAVMNQNSWFGNFFQNYGDAGDLIILFIASEIIGFYALHKFKHVGVKYTVALGAFAFAYNQMFNVWGRDYLYYTASMINNYRHHLPLGLANNDGTGAPLFSATLQWTTAIVSFVIFTYLIHLWLRNKNDAQFDYLLKAALVGIFVVEAAELAINKMKDIWGRFRPYEYSNNNPAEKFTPWYHLNGINGHKSFPSGHTMAGWLVLWATFFVDRQNLKSQKYLTAFGIIFGIVVALSRIRIGAHWASDTIVSSTIVVTIIFAGSRLLGAHFIENNETLPQN
ncbi:phosphatase PAP2 family protein [Periweissella cryptocerci]|nr:phosphatase PAP2 family protein [Periweissella cryptocerci]